MKIKNEQAENFETQNKGWGIKLKKSFRKHNKEKKKRGLGKKGKDDHQPKQVIAHVNNKSFRKREIN